MLCNQSFAPTMLACGFPGIYIPFVAALPLLMWAVLIGGTLELHCCHVVWVHGSLQGLLERNGWGPSSRTLRTQWLSCFDPSRPCHIVARPSVTALMASAAGATTRECTLVSQQLLLLFGTFAVKCSSHSDRVPYCHNGLMGNCYAVWSVCNVPRHIYRMLRACSS